MRKYETIGLIAGAVGVIGVAVHTAMKKSFRSGFDAGTNGTLNTVSEVVQRYNSLVDNYNSLTDDYHELSEEYFDLLDEVETTEE